MKVRLVRGGGLAGTVVTLVVDTATLDEATATDLRARVGACRFDTDGPVAAGADRMRSELQVSDDDTAAHGGNAAGGTRTVRFDEGDPPPGADALVAWLLESPHAERTVGRG